MFPKLITDRTQQDVVAQNDKGTYNATDLNRVTEAMNYLYNLLTSLGYVVHGYTSMTHTWTVADVPTPAQMKQYLDNLQAIRDSLAQQSTTPMTPATMSRLTYQKANDIEKILVDTEYLIRATNAWLIYSGEVYSGEVLE